MKLLKTLKPVRTLCALALLMVHGRARAEWIPMERAIQLAQTRSVSVVDASGQIGVAQAAGVGARVSSLGNPYMELIATYGEENSTSLRTLPTPGMQVSAQVWLPFDVAGQRSSRIAEANSLLEWRKLGLVSARATALGEVLDAYGQAVVSSARLTQAKQGEESARSEAQYFRNRLSASDTTLYEVRLAEAEFARWVQTRSDAELRLGLALNRLSQLTGILPVDAPPENVEYRAPELRSPWTPDVIERAVERTPIIASLRAERSYWSSAQERAEREKYPPLSLIVNAGRGDLAEPRVGGGLAWTFPVTRRNQGEIAHSAAQQSRAASLEATNRNVISARVRAALQAYKTMRETVTFLEQSGLPATEQALQAALEGFRAGKVEVFRVLIARRDLATAHFRRLDLLEALWRVYGDLAAFSGGLP
jgi:cobalt-zinc-cadmium efflux system outer membrane protein